MRIVRELQLRQVLLVGLLVLAALPSRGYAKQPEPGEALAPDVIGPEVQSKSLARWHGGATLIIVENGKLQRVQLSDVGYFEESVFLSENPALTHTLPTGKYSYIIDLGEVSRLSRFSLNNQSASGKFKLYAADALEEPGSASWKPLTKPIKFQSGTIPAVRFDAMEARYILIQFQITEPGKIGNFGLTRMTVGVPAMPETEISRTDNACPVRLVNTNSTFLLFEVCSNSIA